MVTSRRATLLGLATAGLLACSTFQPSPPEQIPFLERAQSETRGGLTITVAVPSRDEARKLFGIDLESKQIQPVYVELQNGTDLPRAILMTGVDPNYFSAREAAYKSHFTWRPGTNTKIDDHFDELGLDTLVAPGESTAGFVFSNLKLGTKEVRVRLHGPQRAELFEFYVAVPGFTADYHEVDWEALESQDFSDYLDEESFRAALRALPAAPRARTGAARATP